MKFPLLGLALAATTLCGCSHTTATVAADSSPKPPPSQVAPPAPSPQTGFDNGLYRGFDRNDYPGDATMAALHNTFAFTGYWLTVPPGETANTWTGKRDLLRRQGWGFLVLANGRLDAEILKSQKHGTTPAQLAQQDAATAVASANSEGFPPQTILFLDQEEGGRLLAEQAAYLLAWTESVAATGFRPGVYASGQPVEDGPGQHITTIEDIRTRVQTGHLHSIAIFDAQDTCPPAPGCTLHPKPLAASGLDNLAAWQYSQSPRRPELTQSCKTTYAPDGNCYAPNFPTIFLDMDAATTSDPSHGR
jgi:hypothetical protein